jgi:hypothetical protein
VNTVKNLLSLGLYGLVPLLLVYGVVRLGRRFGADDNSQQGDADDAPDYRKY